jgi:hypothetical protein
MKKKTPTARAAAPAGAPEFMTTAQFKRARKDLNLSARAMGEALGLRGDPGRTVRRYEAGETITGPIATAVLALLTGFRPPWWPADTGRPDDD